MCPHQICRSKSNAHCANFDGLNLTVLWKSFFLLEKRNNWPSFAQKDSNTKCTHSSYSPELSCHFRGLQKRSTVCCFKISIEVELMEKTKWRGHSFWQGHATTSNDLSSSEIYVLFSLRKRLKNHWIIFYLQKASVNYLRIK